MSGAFRLFSGWVAMALAVVGCGSLAVPPRERETVQPALETMQGMGELGEPVPRRVVALGKVVAAVRTANPQREAAAARLAQAQALAKAARAEGLPTVGGNATVGRGTGGGKGRDGGGIGGEQARLGAEWRWSLDLFGAREAAARAAALRAEAAAFEVLQVERELFLEAARAYFEAATATERLNFNRRQQRLADEMVRLVAAKVKAGLASERELAQVQTLAAQLRSQEAQLRGRVEGAQERLVVVTGGDRRWTEGVDENALPPPPPPPDAAVTPADLLRRRPDVQAAERRLQASLASADERVAARFPSFPLMGSLALAAASPAGWWQASVLSWSWALGLNATLFDGGRLRGEVQAAQAAVEEAVANYRQAVLTAVRACEEALARTHTYYAQMEALQVAAQSAEQAWRLLVAQYRAGLVDFSAVMEAERQWLSAEDGWVEAKGESWAARAELELALGVLW
ncbi:MAG: TolC family protein [Hydrogenophilus sp.]|nr:TolC family protein [Hydrogenophilus sp.]